MEKSTLETLKYKLFCHNWYGSPLSLFLLLNVLTYYWDNWERLHLWYALDWNQGQTTITQCLTWNICCLQMVKFWGVLGKFSQKAYLLGDSWNSACQQEHKFSWRKEEWATWLILTITVPPVPTPIYQPKRCPHIHEGRRGKEGWRKEMN